MFRAEIWKKFQSFLSENFQFLEMKFCTYLKNCIYIKRQFTNPSKGKNCFYFTSFPKDKHLSPQNNITWKRHNMSCNVKTRPFDRYAQRRLNSACKSAQSDKSLRCPHKTLFIIGYQMCPVKLLKRPRIHRYTESLLGSHVRRYIFWRFRSYGFHMIPSDLGLHVKFCIIVSNYNLLLISSFFFNLPWTFNSF